MMSHALTVSMMAAVLAGCSGATAPMLPEATCVGCSEDGGANDSAVDAPRAAPEDASVRGDAATDSAADTFVPDAAPNPGDPCPQHVDLNCDSACGAMDARCATATCGAAAPPTVDRTNELPFTLRTPDRPGADARCAQICGAADTTYGMEIAVELPVAPALRVRVGSPWRLANRAPKDFCGVAAATPGCLVVAGSSARFLVATDDPNAPARNVVIDEVTPGPQACP